MEHVTTPETAQRLKDAGFPQPQPTPGQIWMDGNSDFIVLDFYTNAGGSIVEAVEPLGGEIYKIRNVSELIYAPTATDILRELGGNWFLVYHDTKKSFVCHDIINIFYHTNPAEAAAMAWLDKHENSSTK